MMEGEDATRSSDGRNEHDSEAELSRDMTSAECKELRISRSAWVGVEGRMTGIS